VRKLRKWKFDKYISTHDWQQMSSLSRKRKADGKETAFTLCGKPVTEERIKKRKSRFDYNKLAASSPSSTGDMAAVACTPPASGTLLDQGNVYLGVSHRQMLPFVHFRELMHALCKYRSLRSSRQAAELTCALSDQWVQIAS
jgi:hypothetical protein